MSSSASSSLRFLIACGGTGGHLAPGIALAQRLIARGHSVRLLISAKKVDQRLIQKYPQLTFLAAPASAGLGATHSQISPISLLRFAWHQLASIVFCARQVISFRPAAIIGFGGFLTVSAGVCAAAAGIPLILHEANHKVGRTIRMLRHLATVIYVPPGIVGHGMPPARTRTLGLPLRSDLAPIDRATARTALGIPATGRLLVIMGGSQGSSPLNNWAALHEQRLQAQGIHLYCITGLGKTPPRHSTSVNAQGQTVHTTYVSFCDDMHYLYAAADLVIGRAGAGTIAELIFFRTPSILVPYPFAADNHQAANAENLRRLGGCVVLDEKQVEELLPQTLALLQDSARLTAMQYSLAQVQTTDAAMTLALEVERLGRRRQYQARDRGFRRALQAQGINEELIKLTEYEILANKTTFGIGGPARYYAEPTSEVELAAIARAAHTVGMPFFCLGRGSNLLVLDSGYDGVVVRLVHPSWGAIQPLEGGQIRVGAGVKLKALCAYTCKMGYSGWEFAEGIPATLGGALRMNAGAFKGEVFNHVVSVRYITPQGEIMEVPAAQLQPSYRHVAGLVGAVAVSAILKVEPRAESSAIRQTMEGYQAHRKATQPRGASAGCVFKNPPGGYASQLIDISGLKGYTIGGATVSTLHANYIMNTGTATAADVIALANHIRREVWVRQGVEIQPEIMLLGGQWSDYILPLPPRSMSTLLSTAL